MIHSAPEASALTIRENYSGRTQAIGGRVVTVGRVDVIAADDDALIADWVGEELRDAGIDTGPSDEVVIVVITTAALRDHRWRARIAAVPTTTRLIPLVAGDVHGDDAPDRLAQINWIHADNRSAAAGHLLAAITFEPDNFQVTRLLQEQANKWAADGRLPHQLIDDPSRLRELRRVRSGLDDPNVVELDATARQFLDASIARCQSKRAKRVIQGVIGGFVLVVAVALSVSLVWYINAERRVGRASLTTAQLMGTQNTLAQWSTLSNAEVYLSGSPIQSDLAKTRLHELIGSRNSLGRVDDVNGSVEAVLPDIDGGKALVIMGRAGGTTEVSPFDLRTSAIEAPLDLDGVFQSADFRAGRFLLSGPSGVIGYHDGRITQISDEPALDAWWAGRTGLVIQTADDVILQLDGSATRTISATPADVVSTRADVASGPTIITVDDNRYLVQSLNPADDFVLPVTPGFNRNAAIHPDGDKIVVTDQNSDLVLWADGQITPTGIPAPDSLAALHFLADGRIITQSGALGVEVFHLETGMRLGAVCRQIQSIITVIPSPDGETVSCISGVAHIVDRLPIAPRAEAPDPQTLGSEVPQDIKAALDDLMQEDIRFSFISKSGDSLIVQTASDWIYLFDVEQAGAIGGAMRTNLPDISPLVSASFGDVLQVQTANGWWTIPDCRGCNDVTTLLGRFRDWHYGCWLSTQLQNISSRTREALAVVECKSQ